MAQPSRIIDVGCAEGYYAVGLALRLPQATVVACDTDNDSLSACSQNAKANGVDGRVTVVGELDCARLNNLLDDRSLLVIDCEGCELQLLDPKQVPALRNTWIIAEIHDFVHAAASPTIRSRFEESHFVEFVSAQPRTREQVPLLSKREVRILADEHRPVVPHPMNWAIM